MSHELHEIAEELREIRRLLAGGAGPHHHRPGFPEFKPGHLLGVVNFALNGADYALRAIEGPQRDEISLQGIEYSSAGRAAIAWEVHFGVDALSVLGDELSTFRDVTVDVDMTVNKRVSHLHAQLSQWNAGAGAVAKVTVGPDTVHVYLNDFREGLGFLAALVIIVVVVGVVIITCKVVDAVVASKAITPGSTVTVGTTIAASGSGSVAGVGSGSGSFTAGSTITVNGK